MGKRKLITEQDINNSAHKQIVAEVKERNILLKALIWAIDELESHIDTQELTSEQHDGLIAARKAIAKAEGRS